MEKRKHESRSGRLLAIAWTVLVCVVAACSSTNSSSAHSRPCLRRAAFGADRVSLASRCLAVRFP